MDDEDPVIALFVLTTFSTFTAANSDHHNGKGQHHRFLATPVSKKNHLFVLL